MAQTASKPQHAAPTAPLPGDRAGSERTFGATDAVAVALTLIWLIAVGGYFLLSPAAEADAPDGRREPLAVVMSLLAVFLPVALIWVAATTVRTAHAMRDEAARLQASIDALRQAYISQSQAGSRELSPAIERKLEELVAAQRKTETAIATFASRRDPAQVVPSANRKAALALAPPQPSQAQPALALGTPAEDLREPVSLADFLRALNFPETPDDKAGFRSLRLALEDPRAARLIRAAQDVLTLLSEDGIYMDDLKPDRARPELWRRFAQGGRGGEVSGLGGVRDRSCLALTAGRMREDPVFRDAAHHFLRQFDQMLEELEKNATDQELVRLADTRTARAFMLLGRVTGIFD
jgi:hypothetical protein